MQRLPNKEFNEKEIYNLLNYCKIAKGAEAVVCEGSREDSVYKIFTKDFKIAAMSENKEKKIELLHQLDLDYSTKILSTISCDGKIVGYEMSSNPFLQSYKLYQLPFDNEELLHYFKQTRIILEYFKSKGIMYCDFDPRNILYDRNSGNIIFCDMDNVEINNYPVDMIPWDLYEYNQTRGIDFGVHPYMHNTILLRTLGEDICSIHPITRRKIFYRPAKSIIESMENPIYFNEGYLIDHVKKLSR